MRVEMANAMPISAETFATSYISSYSGGMAETISVRLDDDAQRALAELESTGLTRSEAVRTGLQAAARHLRDRRELAREAELLAGDEADVAEADAVQQMMEDLRAAW